MAKASKKFKPVGDSELAALVQRQIQSSGLYYDTKLSKEREQVLEYYQGNLPKPSHAGNSKYVSMDVFDAVESLKAVLLETFSAGNKIVSFDPQTEADIEPMREATEYADYVIHRQNDSYQIFSDVIQDGLMARTGVAKVYWQERLVEEQEEFENLTIDEVDILASQEDVKDIVELEIDEDTELVSGTLLRLVDKSQVKIDVLPPEEFLITSRSASIAEAPFVAHRTAKTRSELIAEGYPKELVYSIADLEGSDLDMEPDRLARFESIGEGALEDRTNGQEQNEEIMVYESYLHIDMDGTGEAKLWKITSSGGTILDKEQVTHKPFIAFTPLPLPHSFYGSNYAARVIPTQNARTVLMRGILDHTVITNNPRMMVVKGAVTNPRELLENRVGGLVNVTRPDGLLPVPQASLNPFVFQTIQLLDEDKEEVTGVSKLSQGLNKDAVSKQNSQGMVENLVSLSQQREKIIARNFANQFVKELYHRVYELVIANEKTEKIVRIAGKHVPINPQEWAQEVTCTVELKLGYGEQEREAQRLMSIHAGLIADPGNARMYGENNRFYLATKILEASGRKDIAQILTDPSTLPPPQPDPMAVKTMELEERKVATQEAVAKTSAEKVAGNNEIEMLRVQLERMQAQMEAMAKQRELDLKEFDITSKAAIATEELDMARDQQAAQPEQVRAIVSPN